MSELYVTKINTDKGSLQIDYNALAHKPEFDKTLEVTEDGYIADAKATGEKIKAVSNSVTSFKNEINTKVDGFSSSIEAFQTEVNTKMNNFFTQTESGEGDDKTVTTTINSEISMGEKKITNLGAPENDADAATKKYVDDAVGGIFKQEDGEGDNDPAVTIIQTTIQMAEDTKITGLEAPTEDADAANKKYVDDESAKLKEYVNGRHLYTTVTLESDEWVVGEAAQYTQEIKVEGMSKNDAPHWGLVYSEIEGEEMSASEKLEYKILEQKLYALVDDMDSDDGKVIFTCFKNKPSKNLTIQIEVNRQWEKASSTE